MTLCFNCELHLTLGISPQTALLTMMIRTVAEALVILITLLKRKEASSSSFSQSGSAEQTAGRAHLLFPIKKGNYSRSTEITCSE